MDMMWYRRRGLMVTPHLESVTGAIASFNSDYNKIPIKSLICNIEPIQEGTGDPSPENVRPISGRAGLSAWRTGKNLLKTAGLIEGTPSNTAFSNATKRTFTAGTFVPKLTNNNYYQTSANVQFSVSENSIKVTSSARNYAISIPIVELKIGETYVLSCTKTNASNNTASFYKQDGTFISSTPSLTICKFTVPEETYYTLLHFNPSENNVEATFTDIQLELGESETNYEPYQDNAYSANWETEAGTVYGGTLDVVSGKLTVDRVKETKTWGTAGSGTALTNVTRKKWNFERAAKYIRTDARDDLLCNCIGMYSVSYSLDDVHMYITDENYAYIYLPTTTDDSTVIELSYTFADPIEYQLTTQEVHTLLGVNNIWCDSGDVSVNYWKWGK